jgi:hypothetical protein
MPGYEQRLHDNETRWLSGPGWLMPSVVNSTALWRAERARGGPWRRYSRTTRTCGPHTCSAFAVE